MHLASKLLEVYARWLLCRSLSVLPSDSSSSQSKKRANRKRIIYSQHLFRSPLTRGQGAGLWVGTIYHLHTWEQVDQDAVVLLQLEVGKRHAIREIFLVVGDILIVSPTGAKSR